MAKSLEGLIRQYWQENRGSLNFSFAAVATIDFDKSEIDSTQLYLAEKSELISIDDDDDEVIFDLASLTKPLVLGLAKLAQPEIFDKNLDLLLHHRAGLPAFGNLSKSNWKEHLESFAIQESETLYSDYSALRTMLEFDKKSDKSMREITFDFYDEITHWLDLTSEQKLNCPITGQRNKEPIQGQVHDPNAYNLNCFCSHAGMFGSVNGLANSLIKLNSKFDLFANVSAKIRKDYRFVEGFDRVEDATNTLAGEGCSDKTFGHLGFTGTCFWIDPKEKKGWVLLTNATEKYWYERTFLNGLRRLVGKSFWSGIPLK